MRSDKLTEFVTVLIFAMVIGGGAMLAIMNLNGNALMFTLAILVIAAVASWQYLRKRFRRP